MTKYICLVLVAAAFATGCANDPPGTKTGLHNTIAYTISIESSEPGTKIEVNYKPVGVAPVKVEVFGDRDGTFHNFGSDEFIVRAYPPNANEFPQTRILKTGAMGVKDDKIPERIYFDFATKPKTP